MVVQSTMVAKSMWPRSMCNLRSSLSQNLTQKSCRMRSSGLYYQLSSTKISMKSLTLLTVAPNLSHSITLEKTNSRKKDSSRKLLQALSPLMNASCTTSTILFLLVVLVIQEVVQFMEKLGSKIVPISSQSLIKVAH